jgi:tetratricopeptide (TPR) repeat protein
MGSRFFPLHYLGLCTFLTALSLSSFSYGDVANSSPKEALILRRITEYWKDGDYSAVKKQILDFIDKNPETNLRDHLSAMLGDIYFQEKNYRQALATYALIGNCEIQEKTFFNRLQAHFESREFPAVVEEAEKYLKQNKGKGNPLEVKVRYLLAESCFRQALKTKSMEEKIFYLKQAKPHYTVLTQTKYSDRALFPLAEIHRLLREDARAAALFLNLAEKYPEHKERFLFQAAILQIKEDKNEAIKTFCKVHEMGGKRSRLSAYNQLILMYQAEDYEGFLKYSKDMLGQMPEEKLPLLRFYEGRCHYFLGDYQQAVLPLEEFVTKTNGRSKEMKTAYLLLVNCSRYLKDLPLLERTLYSFKTAFPKDSEVPKVLMIHAQMCRENGNFNQALTDLKALTQEFPGYPEAEAVMYDYGLLLSQTDRWAEAREMFLSFIEKYPLSERKNGAWRHLLNCCIEEVKNPSQPTSTITKQNFIKILRGALSENHILTDKEREQYRLVLMKCQCELEQYHEMLPMLKQYIADVVDESLLSEAYLLMAITEHKHNSDLNQFIHFAEKALGYNKRLPEEEILHLELYNAYLTQGAAAANCGDREFMFDFAADHLYASGAWKQHAIKLDNYLWLAHHFYEKALEGKKEDFEKANLLFCELLGIHQEHQNLHIPSDALYLEGEALKYAHLLGETGHKNDQIALLEKLAHQQEEQKQLNWKLKQRTLLELAKSYQNNHRYQDALNTYRFIIKAADRTLSMVACDAQLNLAKLEYQLLKPHQRVKEGAEITSILHTLKDLQIQKKLNSEPIHLEAALQYVEIRCQLSELDSQAKNAFFYYKRMLEDFTSGEDPIAEEYNRLRMEQPEKNAIFKAYMGYVDAQMLKWQAELAKEEKNFEKASQSQQKALQILNSLEKKKSLLKPYLFERVQRAKVELTSKS